MSARVDLDAQGALGPSVASPGAMLAPVPVVFDNEDRFGGPALPSDHPKWLTDAISLSSRARALVVKLKPVVLHAIAAWEHRVRTIVVGGRNVRVDASGSYRMD